MKLTVTYEPAKDAENYIRAIFDNAFLKHGRVDMKEKLLASVESIPIKNVLTSNVTRDIALKTTIKLLSDAPIRITMEENAKKLKSAFTAIGEQLIFQLETLYKQDWPFEKIHVDLTTLQICPYNFKERRIFIHGLPNTQTQLRILSHELNHFMFYNVYAEALKDKLTHEQFELLKESLTIFTNPEQSGKPNEEPLRQLYINKKIRTVDHAVMIGVAQLQQQSNQTD
jgi:hypothetical protein